jgi:hypothetical protein
VQGRRGATAHTANVRSRVGFAVWTGHCGGRTVTFPARHYSADGRRRTFTLLRDVAGHEASLGVRDLILQAYAEHEATPGACRTRTTDVERGRDRRPRFFPALAQRFFPARRAASALRGVCRGQRKTSYWTAALES